MIWTSLPYDIFYLSPVSPKGEKRFAFLCIYGFRLPFLYAAFNTVANWLLPFRGGEGEVVNDYP